MGKKTVKIVAIILAAALVITTLGMGAGALF